MTSDDLGFKYDIRVTELFDGVFGANCDCFLQTRFNRRTNERTKCANQRMNMKQYHHRESCEQE